MTKAKLEGNIMKSLIQTGAIVVALAFPIASFAQSSESATPAQVQVQVAPLEQTGYNTTGDHAHGPVEIKVAEASVDQPGDASAAYGGVVDGASQSSTGIHALYDVGLKSIYIKH
jgi:hypothetical protein